MYAGACDSLCVRRPNAGPPAGLRGKSGRRGSIPGFFLGCQGPGLFTYNFLRLAFSNHRNLGAYLHNHRVKALFLQMFACLPEQEPERGVCLAYLAGAYCHYVCDSVCHTFVYARTGYDPAHKSAR